MSERPTIIAANRAPLALRPDPDHPGQKRLVKGEGGVTTAMLAVGARTNATFLAMARNDDDRHLASLALPGEPAALLAPDGRTYRVGFVDPGTLTYDLYYHTMANPNLWCVQHKLWRLPLQPPGRTVTDYAWHRGYVPANQAMADRIVEEGTRLGGRPRVLLQDYHFYLVAGMVRKRLPNAQLQLFVHIPWPEPQEWRLNLPAHIVHDLLVGILGNDIVGFQTPGDAANFAAACREMLGARVDEATGTIRFRGRDTLVRAYPIGIDPACLAAQAAAPEVEQVMEVMEAGRPCTIIFRCDRADLSKNIPRGFHAYGRLLDQHPELVGRIQFWASIQETRGGVDEYRRYMEQIRTSAQAINDRYPGAAVPPVYLDIQENYPRTLAGFRMYDVLLVNPEVDGMNLVAKEGPMVNERLGVLVLSRNAGAHRELGPYAVSVDPFDIQQQADALFEAITMAPTERAARQAGLRRVVAGNDVFRWIDAIVRDLDHLDLPRRGHGAEEMLEGKHVIARADPTTAAGRSVTG